MAGGLVFSLDRHTLISGGADHTVRFWETDPDRVAARICANVNPPITSVEWFEYFSSAAYQPPC
ncbi:MAG TPA: hypothetical protein VG247_35740 [Pseudonocardiaceae bacterium]|nr:hypothetical protein [Pseudonocardiaceae bacterium]